jgi:hypothetical protein
MFKLFVRVSCSINVFLWGLQTRGGTRQYLPTCWRQLEWSIPMSAPTWQYPHRTCWINSSKMLYTASTSIHRYWSIMLIYLHTFNVQVQWSQINNLCLCIRFSSALVFKCTVPQRNLEWGLQCYDQFQFVLWRCFWMAGHWEHWESVINMWVNVGSQIAIWTARLTYCELHVVTVFLAVLFISAFSRTGHFLIFS